VDDVVYQGCRIRPLAWTIPMCGFGAKVLIWPGTAPDEWSQLIVLPGSWDTEEDARRAALEEGRRAVDAGVARE
jgi:hypothetical protein